EIHTLHGWSKKWSLGRSTPPHSNPFNLVMAGHEYFQNSLPLPRLGILYPTTDRFFSIYDDVVRYSAIVESVDAIHCSDHDTITIEQSKSSSLWVEADVITDLDIISLLNNQNDVPPTALSRSLSKKPSLG
ncbi:hypothetical protein H0E87_012517, partial [Populus deltoides]